MPRTSPRPSRPARAPASAPAESPGAGVLSLLAAFLLHEAALPAAWLVRLAPSPEDVDALVARGLVVEGDDGAWRLAPGNHAVAHLRATPWATRQRVHRALATLCREARLPAEEARHWCAVGETARALDAWHSSASEALAAGRRADALSALEASLRAGLPDPAAETRLADILRLCVAESALGDELFPRLETWIEQAAWRERPALLATALLGLAGLHAERGLHVAGAGLRVRAAEILRAGGDLAGCARQLVAAAVVLAFALHHTAARQTGERALAAAEACGDVACRVDAASHLGLLVGMQGDAAAGRAHLEAALDLALRHGLAAAAAEAYRMLGTVAEYASCYGDQQTAFARALSYCRRHAATATAELCLGCLSYSLFRSGNWSRARRVAREVLARPGSVSHSVAAGTLGLLLAHRGELRDAVPLLETSRAAAHRLGILGIEFFCAWGLALVDTQAGRPGAAALHYRRVLDFWRGTEDRHDAIPALTGGALFFADQDDPRAASGFATALRGIADHTANPEARGALALVEGERLRREGNTAAAITAFRQALDAFELRELVVERIRVLPRLAAALRAAGDQAGADLAWEEATRRGRRLGMRGLLALEEEVVFSPAPPASAPRVCAGPDVLPPDRPGAADAWSGLSPRQRDVARLLATGATNKEIAARLGLGVRTIDMHVGHLLARLDCRGRTEAAARITTLLA